MGMATMAGIAVGGSLLSGFTQYSGAKDSIKAAESEKRNNIEREKTNAAIIERNREVALKDKARKDRIETGQNISAMADSGFNLSSGTILDQMIANETAQQLDTNRLSTKYDDNLLQEKMLLNDKNFSLDMQIANAKQAKIGAIANTVSGVASTGMSYASSAANKPKKGGTDLRKTSIL